MSDAPKYTTRFILVRSGFDPDTSPCDTWNPCWTEKEARAARKAAEFSASGSTRQVIVRVDTTYTIVDDGGTGQA